MWNLTSQVYANIIMIQEVWIDDDKYFRNYWKGELSRKQENRKKGNPNQRLGKFASTHK